MRYHLLFASLLTFALMWVLALVARYNQSSRGACGLPSCFDASLLFLPLNPTGSTIPECYSQNETVYPIIAHPCFG